MNVQTDIAMEEWAGHPFVARLNRYVPLTEIDLKHLRRLIESDLIVERRRDLVVDGCEYRKLCFVVEGCGRISSRSTSPAFPQWPDSGRFGRHPHGPSAGLAIISQKIASTAAKAGKPNANQTQNSR